MTNQGGGGSLRRLCIRRRVAFTDAVQREFYNTRQRCRSMLPTGSATTAARSPRTHTRLFFEMRRSERDRHRCRPLQRRGSFHFSIARFWRAIFAAARHRISLPPKQSCVRGQVSLNLGQNWRRCSLLGGKVKTVSRISKRNQPEKLAFYH